MIPYGKHSTRTVERWVFEVSPEHPEGEWVWRAVEMSVIEPDDKLNDTRVEYAARTRDFHHETCQGVRGVRSLFWRDGRYWCLSCYTFKYGTSPYLEPEKWGKHRPVPRPQTIAERLAQLS